MHEAAFSQAALPAPAIVLGLELKPYSLGHELWLIRQNNPLAWFAQGISTIEQDLKALPEAALICCQSYRENCRMNRDLLIGLKLRLWKFRTRKLRFEHELLAFKEYQRVGAIAFPDELPDRSGPARTPGSPFLLRLHQFLMNFFTEDQAWDYLLGLAMMRYACRLESDGALNVKNEYDVEFDRQYAEWDAKQTADSTFKRARN